MMPSFDGRRIPVKQYITIRRAKAADYSAISAILAVAYVRLKYAYDPLGFDNALPLMSKANPKLIASGTYYIADIEDLPAGCGGWSPEQPGTGTIADGVGHIRHFATHPAHARKGVARALLDRCLAEARQRGITTMMSNSTLPAVAFYESAGFEKLGVTDVEMGPGIVLPAVQMRLKIV
jgi:GNAT superfamily N-acetyltransferase